MRGCWLLPSVLLSVTQCVLVRECKRERERVAVKLLKELSAEFITSNKNTKWRVNIMNVK